MKLAGWKVPIRVPRVRGPQGEVRLASYEDLHRGGALNEELFLRVLYGISCRNYAQAATAVPGAIGLSSSSVSREFVTASAECLRRTSGPWVSSWSACWGGAWISARGSWE